MVQDRSAGVSALDKHRQQAAERKGRRNIKVMPAQKGSASRSEKSLTGPSQKSRKCSRDSGNIATTTRSHGSLPAPSPRREAIEVGETSPRHVENVFGPTEAGARPSALDLLGGGLQFTRRVCVTLPQETRELI